MKASDHASHGPVEPKPDPETVFLIAPNAGVWTVTKDSAFFGDYLKEEHAQASAQCAVAAILANGGAAKACLLPGPASGPKTPHVPTVLGHRLQQAFSLSGFLVLSGRIPRRGVIVSPDVV